MKIDNEKNYESLTCGFDQGTGGWAFSNTGEPRETAMGTAFLVSNYHGLYGVVVNGIMHLVTDNWGVANTYRNNL